MGGSGESALEDQRLCCLLCMHALMLHSLQKLRGGRRLGLPLLGLLLRVFSALILCTQSLTALGEQPSARAVPLMVLSL